MKTRHLFLAALSLLVGLGSAGVAQANNFANPTVSFEAGDSPGNFFTCLNTANSKSIGCVPTSIGGKGQKSLAVIAPGETVGFPTFGGEASTVHTALSLLWPKGAEHMPFKAAIDVRDPAKRGVATVRLWKPGLYVFICDIHPYMFSAVIVDDPVTKVDSQGNKFPGLGLDLGRQITLVNGVTVPTFSDLAIRLLRTFFIITDPTNWKDYNKDSWTPTFPPVPVIAYKHDGTRVDVSDLSAVLGIGTVDLKADANKLFKPALGKEAVGEIWVDTQFELTAGKSKSGTATAIDGTTWGVTKKIAIPEHNMNHPHNMWTDRNQSVIYQTQWFDERMTVFDRTTGKWMYDVPTGPAPSHVMTKSDDDKVHVAQNGGNNVREFGAYDGTTPNAPLPMIRDIPMGSGGEDVFTATHPHGHWMSSSGRKMVTPNENLNTSTVYNFPGGAIQATVPTGHVPIATGMMPDSSKYYVANFLDSTITVIDMNTNTVMKTINLLDDTTPPENGTNKYDPITGEIQNFVGALPIQTPVSPDGTNMVTANTLTATITIVDTKKDKVVAMLPCDPGCHGVQYGAKKGGGYYAYIANKFSNAMLIVDPDPDGDGDPSNAAIVGRVLLGTMGTATTDVPTPDTVIGNPGMGGQGVLPVPVAYNGWVQQWVEHCSSNDCNAWKGSGGLTEKQKNPGSVK